MVGKRMLLAVAVVACMLGAVGQASGSGTYAIAPTTYSWVDPSSHTAITLTDDGVSPAQTLPFTFTFYGTPYTQVYVGANGLVGFASAGLDQYGNRDIPIADATNNAIYAYWDDLYPPQGGTVRVGASGSAPNRRMVISWVGIPHISNFATTLTFQILLCEGSNNIIFQYQEVMASDTSYGAGWSATIGIENAAGTEAAKYSYSGSTLLSNGQALLFAPPLSTTIAGLTPNEGSNAGGIEITNLSGSGFASGASVKLTKTGQPDIVATNVTVVSDTKITCRFDLTDKALGAWDVVVTNPGGSPATFPGGFTVRSVDCGFEAGELNRWPWVTSGQGYWEAWMYSPGHRGSRCFHLVNWHNGTANVELRLAGSGGYVSFFVSGGGGFDIDYSPWRSQLDFSIDGVWQGGQFYDGTDYMTYPWEISQLAFPLLAGTHVCKWTQSNAIYTGDFKGIWIDVDDIMLPPGAIALSGITPSTGSNAGVVTITDIAGGGFQPGAVVRLRKSGQADIVAANVVVVNSGKITCQFDLTGKALGQWSLVVTNPGGVEIDMPNAFTILENVAPTISRVTASPSMVAGGDQVQVQVTATDNIGVTSVTANSVALTQSGSVWRGSIAAASPLGSHSILAVARDAAGNTATNSACSYKTARVVGIPISRTLDQVVEDGCWDYLYKVWGRVTKIDLNAFWLDSGSEDIIEVYAPGYESTGITDGSFAAARGILDVLLYPPLLLSQSGMVTKLQ